MKNILLLFLFCHVSSSVKHSWKFFFTTSTGISNLPDFMGTLLVDDIVVGYCDSNKGIEQHHAGKIFFHDHPEILQEYSQECLYTQPKQYKARLEDIMQHLNQSGGVHVLQSIQGCEWDERRLHIIGVEEVDVDRSETTGCPNQQIWDGKDRIKRNELYFTEIYPDWLKKYLRFENSSLLRTVPPSVSLLQKTPSSPVSCHATGFYPDRASMFWRKDGEEIHERGPWRDPPQP
uniref:Ig-like domain-containing protein n=1 Tax=Anabas testudineus TaxID=64144 RepID=A0A7N6AMS8_ANATE